MLYWMIAFRRATHNFALDRAVELAEEHGRPLLILEALRVGYPWASDRLHAFVLAGMRDNQQAFAGTRARYYPYVEREADAGHGLVEALAERAVAIVTDDFPCFFLPRMTAALAQRANVRVEAVDSNGVLPLAVSDRAYARAFDFRKHVLRSLVEHAQQAPAANPLRKARLPELRSLPKTIQERWPAASTALLEGEARALAALPIDHSVGATATRGGSVAASGALRRFIEQRLEDYADARNHPDLEASSQLSPYLHFGQISAHEVLARVLAHEDCSLADLHTDQYKKPSAFWQLRPGAEAFLDQLLTWRELSYNLCAKRPHEYDKYSVLPSWARQSLAKHRTDERDALYSRARLEHADTGDELWNAAQRELLRTGHLHNYLRMLWGKRVIAWSKTPEAAFETLIHLNNKYALDGRDPNSCSGIGWCFGLFDRAWGPERPIYGLVRYMTSESARRKLKLKRYLERFGHAGSPRLPGM